jgi:hypothetical protein
MTCLGCEYDRDAESGAMIALVPSPHTCSEPAIDLLTVSPESFRSKPQIGTATRPTFAELGACLARPLIGDAKDCAGAYSPALYTDNVRRKPNLVKIWAMVVDIDQGGDVDRVVQLVGRYRAIVHSTFSSTEADPRCRVLILLAEAVDAATYEAAHKVVRAHLTRTGAVADEGAKDASRVSYWPVVRPGASFRCVEVDGVTLDARAVIAAQPPPAPKSAPRLVAPEHRDVYIQAALRKAADAVASASKGERHYVLCKEAYSLKRLDLSEGEIASVLVPAFVACTDESRRREGERTVADACAARGVA